jgi:AraC-like DNA-binding protein/ligand-binding sensor protein
VEEQISLFTAATGVKVRFTPSAEAVLLGHLTELCELFRYSDGSRQAACQTWHECQGETIRNSIRAIRLRCPMQLDQLWAPVAKGGEIYGFLYTEPVMLDGQADGNGRTTESPATAGNGAQESPEAFRRIMKLHHQILRVNVGRSDGILVLLELMGLRLGTRFQHERRLPAASSPSEALVRRAEAVLCGCYHDDISTCHIAERLNVSESHLCHAFREVTNSTLREYLNELRFTEACRLLKECPHLRVAEIAFAAGFQSLSRFSEQFRRRGLPSPGKWRRCEVP